MTIWADLGVAPAWPGALTSVTQGDVILGVDGGIDYVWFAEEDFTTGATEPVWDAPSFSMPDGDGSWGLVDAWEAVTDYVSNDLTQPTTPNGHGYKSLGSGESGATEPSLWETDGDPTDDGGTGGSDGELIPPDPDDNDDGNPSDTIPPGAPLRFQLWENPALDRDAASLGEIVASGKTIRTVRNNCGEGWCEVNANDEQFADLIPGRIVVAYRGSFDTEPKFAWIIEKIEQIPLTPDEEGGETAKVSGRGALALLDRFSLLNISLLPNGDELGALPQTDRDGRWHWKHKRGIAILIRQLEEQRYFGTYFYSGIQDSPCPSVYVTFSRYIDTNGDPVDNEDADAYKLDVGDNLFGDVLPKLMQIGLMIRATPVINGDGHLRIRLDSWVNDPGAETGITFAKGDNIREVGTKNVEAFNAGTFALVQGDTIATGPDTGTYNYATVDDSGLRARFGTIVRFLPYQATPTDALLERAGERLLAQGQKRHDGPTTLEVTESEGQVALVDYIEWDYVTVDIPNAWDEYHDNLSEIIIAENEIGEVDVGLRFADDDPVGVIGIAVDNCTCSQEPEEPET